MSQTITAKVVRLSYCEISAVLYSNYETKQLSNKCIYFHKYPPLEGTTGSPKLEEHSSVESLIPDTITKTQFKNFWLSTSDHQDNGEWKGGQWGYQNLPLTDNSWLDGIFIGDNITINKMFDGYIKYDFRGTKSDPFVGTETTIIGTENMAWSVNINFNGISKKAFMTDNIMPQKAIDVLLFYKNTSTNQTYIRILCRNYPTPNASTDMPGKFAPGAGEHREPGGGPLKKGFENALSEEMGITSDIIKSGHLIDIGTFFNHGRDPRYWKYSIKNTKKRLFDEINNDDIYQEYITFGEERLSETVVSALYIENDVDFDESLLDENQIDKEEIKTSFWKNIDDEFLKKQDIWMIPEHREYIEIAKKSIKKFSESL